MFGCMPIARTHRMAETSGAGAGAGAGGGAMAVMHGLMRGSRVISNLGWCAIEALSVGDKVLTCAHGMQEVTALRRSPVWTTAQPLPHAAWPLFVPARALCNRVDMHLLPAQGVWVEAEPGTRDGDAGGTLRPAAHFEGLRGIRRVPPMQSGDVITLFFAQDEAIYADGGFLAHCPAQEGAGAVPVEAIGGRDRQKVAQSAMPAADAANVDGPDPFRPARLALAS